jgi:hypothetical protein
VWVYAGSALLHNTLIAGNFRGATGMLSVNRPVFQEGDTEALQLDFALVNDSDKVIDPLIAPRLAKPPRVAASVLGTPGRT